MLTEADLQTVTGHALTKMGEISARCRLPGMTRDLTQSEIRNLAMYEASLITAFNKLGHKLTDEQLREVYPVYFQEVQRPIEGEDFGYSSK